MKVGDVASIKHVCTANYLHILARASGNANPIHLSREHGKNCSAAEAEREIEE
jgi:hypothetical protein